MKGKFFDKGHQEVKDTGKKIDASFSKPFVKEKVSVTKDLASKVRGKGLCR